MSKGTGRVKLLSEVATILADYRAEEIDPIDADHVDRWVSQFAPSAQDVILAEMAHVLPKAYASKANARSFVKAVLRSDALAGCGKNAPKFWKKMNFLRDQGHGSSQTELLALFDEQMESEFGFDTLACGSPDGPFLYLDDGVFTGARVRADVLNWLANAPSGAKLYIVVIALYRGGQWWADKSIKPVAKEKSITVQWLRLFEFENRKSYKYTTDVLRLAVVPTSPLTQEYVASLGYPPVLRSSPNQSKLFSSEKNRVVVEEAFLEKGLWIRAQCNSPNKVMRPLGFMMLDDLGFGALFATYRNCPNNCPLVLWWGRPDQGHPLDSWYPLLPRKSGIDGRRERLEAALFGLDRL
jgi:hypothetical protein